MMNTGAIKGRVAATISGMLMLGATAASAYEAGVDFDLGNDLVLSGQLWYLDIETDARLLGTTLNVDVDPWVFMVGIGKKF